MVSGEFGGEAGRAGSGENGLCVSAWGEEVLLGAGGSGGGMKEIPKKNSGPVKTFELKGGEKPPASDAVGITELIEGSGMKLEKPKFFKPKKEKKLSPLMEVAKEFTVAATTKGCPQDQIFNFLKANVFIQSKQLEFAAMARSCDLPDGPKVILCGGGRGSAKSHGILAQIFCDDCQRVPGLKVLFLRKVGRANKEQIQDFRKKLLGALPHNYREQASTITFENGSLVVLGNFKDEKDIDKYLGLEYDLIYIMESNQLTQSKKMNIVSCLRTNKPNWRTRVYQDTNPGGIDHVANKAMFIDGKWLWNGFTYEKIGVEKETRYIHSTVDDNRFVDAEYKTNVLEKYVGWQREAWLFGNWEFMAGAFFSNFHADVHVYPNPVTTLNERAITRWFAGLDYGYSHPTAFSLCCEDENGNIFVVAEYGASNTLIEEHAANIKDLCSLHGLDVGELEFVAAGRDCFRVDKDGSTVATEYSERGIMLTAVHIDRVNAWSQVAEVFGDVQNQIKPRCFIHKNCTNLIQQIQCAQSDPKKPNDILKMNADPETGEGGDDHLENFRNAIVMAYSSLLSHATPVKMGNYESAHEAGNGTEYVDVEAVIREAEAVDLSRNLR
jgi:phage terminase large subunit